MITDLAMATPPQVDEARRTLLIDCVSQWHELQAAFDAVHVVLGEEPIGREPIARTWNGRTTYVQVWPTPITETLTTARALPADTPARGNLGGAPGTVGEAVSAMEALQADIRAMQRRLDDLNVEYTRRGGWNQYYRAVKSGHVHMSMACHTTFPRTEWDWLTDLSGADAAQVAANKASVTCRVCFAEGSLHFDGRKTR